MARLRMRPRRPDRRSARGVPFAFGLGCAVVLGFGLSGCAGPESSPTSIPIPSVVDTGMWGTYDSKADACFGVAGDVLSLALVPNNLSLADPESGVSDIDSAIQTAGDAAPGAIAPHYRQMSELVRSFGNELSEWSAAVSARVSATPTATPSTVPTTSAAPSGASPQASAPRSAPGSSASPTPTPDDLPRPAFDGAAFTDQLDSVKAWLSSTCG